MAANNYRRHGHRRSDAKGGRSSTYVAWEGMVQRCTDENSRAWPRYGGRGITVCERWRSFENFLADLGERPEGKTIDRIDNDGHYEPGNCRWATPTEQANNRSNNHLLTFNGETHSVCEWARRVGIAQHIIRRRVFSGWPLDLALTRPPLKGWRGANPRKAKEA